MSLLEATVRRDSEGCRAFLPLCLQDWMRLVDVASSHGVAGLVSSALELLPEELLPTADLMMDLLGQAEQFKDQYRSAYGIASRFAAELERYRMDARSGELGCVVPAGAWHTVEVMEPSVIMEVKAGRYGEDGSEMLGQVTL